MEPVPFYRIKIECELIDPVPREMDIDDSDGRVSFGNPLHQVDFGPEHSGGEPHKLLYLGCRNKDGTMQEGHYVGVYVPESDRGLFDSLANLSHRDVDGWMEKVIEARRSTKWIDECNEARHQGYQHGRADGIAAGRKEESEALAGMPWYRRMAYRKKK